MSPQYHIDSEKISLKRFQTSLESRELIPSRVKLKEKLKSRFKTIHSAGVNTLGDLISVLKNKGKVEAFSKKTELSLTFRTPRIEILKFDFKSAQKACNMLDFKRIKNLDFFNRLCYNVPKTKHEEVV